MARTVKEKPDALFCLLAEESAVRTYEILKKMSERGEADFTQARFVQMIEIISPEDQKGMCSAFLYEHFFEPLGIRDDQICLFNTDAEDIDKECANMDRYLEKAGDIDFMLLGIGPDGQLGFNEPGELFDQGIRVKNLSESMKQEVEKCISAEVCPNQGITMGMQQIFCAEKVVLMAGTKQKADIMAKTYDTLPQIAIPATAMFLLKNGTVLMDREAALQINGI